VCSRKGRYQLQRFSVAYLLKCHCYFCSPNYRVSAFASFHTEAILCSLSSTYYEKHNFFFRFFSSIFLYFSFLLYCLSILLDVDIEVGWNQNTDILLIFFFAASLLAFRYNVCVFWLDMYIDFSLAMNPI